MAGTFGLSGVVQLGILQNILNSNNKQSNW